MVLVIQQNVINVMEQIKMKKKKIRFYSGTHNYFYGKQKLKSVTTFIGQFFNKFDAKKIARKLAKFPVNKANKRGVRYWLKEWKKSAEHGSVVHKLIEEYIIGNMIPLTITDEQSYTKRDRTKLLQAMTWYDEWNENTWTLKQEAEKIIFSEELGIAGTIELYAETPDGITLIDWKTNKRIDNKGYGGKKGLEPIEELEDCHLTKYTLQLSLYAYILEKYYDKKMHQLILVHLMEDKYEEYIVPYEKEIIEKLLEYDKNE